MLLVYNLAHHASIYDGGSLRLMKCVRNDVLYSVVRDYYVVVRLTIKVSSVNVQQFRVSFLCVLMSTWKHMHCITACKQPFRALLGG